MKRTEDAGRVETARTTMEKLGVKVNDASAFPEFEAVKNRFIYGEVLHQGQLPMELRHLVTVAALVTVEGGDLKQQLEVALKNGISPAALQEVFHQAAPYIGFAKVEKGLAVLKKVFEENGIALPLAPQATVTEDDRLKKGIAAQKSIFGAGIDAMRANAPENRKFMQDYLSAYCFGDTYTRGTLKLQTRELLTFVCITCLGGCDSQANAHAMGNLAVGNTAETLFAATAQCLPYIGFPRTLNAMTAVDNAVGTLEKQKSNR